MGVVALGVEGEVFRSKHSDGRKRVSAIEGLQERVRQPGHIVQAVPHLHEGVEVGEDALLVALHQIDGVLATLHHPTFVCTSSSRGEVLLLLLLATRRGWRQKLNYINEAQAEQYNKEATVQSHHYVTCLFPSRHTVPYVLKKNADLNSM